MCNEMGFCFVVCVVLPCLPNLERELYLFGMGVCINLPRMSLA